MRQSLLGPYKSKCTAGAGRRLAGGRYGALSIAFVTAQCWIFSPNAVALPVRTPNDSTVGLSRLTLRLHPPIGQSYRTTATVSTKTSESLGESQRDAQQQLSFALDSKILEVDGDGICTVAVTIVQLRMSAQGNGGGESFDSSRPPAAPTDLIKLLGAIVGSTFNVAYDSHGGVIQISGMKQLFQRVLKSINPRSNNSEAAETAFRANFGDSAIRQLAAGFVCLPASNIGIGDAWSNPALSSLGLGPSLGFDSRLKATFSLKKRQDGRATVAVQFATRPGDRGNRLDVGTTSELLALQTYGSGTYLIDEATGWTLGCDFSLRGSGNMAIEDLTNPDSRAPAAAYPIFFKSTVHLDSMPVAAPAPAVAPSPVAVPAPSR